MTHVPTTLVLGAGASCGYGLPTGAGLRQRILAYPDAVHAPSLLGLPEREVLNFIDVFRRSQLPSIDAFLGRRQELETVGKTVMAHVLLTCEWSANLLNENHNDHWYQYLLQRLATDKWENLDFSWLSVVTFNYDRSLEVFLCTALQHAYGKTEAEVVEKLKALRIVHVYGSLGSPWGTENFVPFVRPIFDVESAIRRAAAGVHVMEEGRLDSDRLQAARRFIAGAERVCFLGFGFDSLNVERMGATITFLPTGAQANKLLVGTVKGMTSAEADRAIRQVCGSSIGAPQFLDANCLDLLRATLVLE